MAIPIEVWSVNEGKEYDPRDPGMQGFPISMYSERKFAEYAIKEFREAFPRKHFNVHKWIVITEFGH